MKEMKMKNEKLMEQNAAKDVQLRRYVVQIAQLKEEVRVGEERQKAGDWQEEDRNKLLKQKSDELQAKFLEYFNQIPHILAENGAKPQVEEEKATECAICLKTISQNVNQKMKKKGIVPYITPCEHVFHKACLVEWLNKNASCPICRVAIEKGKIQ